MACLIKADQNNPSDEVLDRAVQVLNHDGVCIMPTDSVYGIGCAAYADNPAHERIFIAKKRDRAQTLPLLLASPDDLFVYGRDVPQWMEKLVKTFWPGALTVVVKASEQLPAEYVKADGTIALRVPNSNLVRALAAKLGTPLATTSANIHGIPAATSGSSLDQQLCEQVDLVIDAGPAPIAIASTIVGVCLATSGELEPVIYREAALSVQQIYDAIGC